MAYLRDLGYRVEVVEKWNAFTKTKKDLFGCIDLIAIGNGETLAVQVTSRSNMSSRRAKILAAEAFPDMIRSGWQVWLHGWAKNRSNRWEIKAERLSEGEHGN
jgi:hypothetical protein